jgi:IS30 family transposase
MPALSWENPRNTKEIGMVTRSAIIQQWFVPSITFDEGFEVYDHDENTSSFVVQTYKTRYRVLIERIEDDE